MDTSKQKKSKEINTENSNKSTIQNKKKEEPKKITKKSPSNKNEPQNNNDEHLHTIQKEHRKTITEYLGGKKKVSNKGETKKNTTPKKVQTIEKKKLLNKTIDNDSENIVLGRSMSFRISYNNAKQISKKEGKPKETKNNPKTTKKPLIKKKEDKPLNNKNQEIEVIFNYNGINTTIKFILMIK